MLVSTSVMAQSNQLGVDSKAKVEKKASVETKQESKPMKAEVKSEKKSTPLKTTAAVKK